jgi:hypothetical protein
LQDHEPKLGRLCRVLASQIGHGFHTNLYLTPPHGQGFFPHWDDHDVFILQVVGSKHWKLEKQRRAFPGVADGVESENLELQGEIHSFTLEQGDVIYIPSGYVHAAECGSDSSLHVTLGLAAIRWRQLLDAVVKAAIRRDDGLRLGLPLGFMHGSREALVNRVTGVLRQLSDETLVSEIVDQFRDELVGRFPLDVSGQVEDFFKPIPLTLGDCVGARSGIAYQMHAGDDSVRLNFASRSIVFGDFFRDALDFALKTPAYAVRDIPGDLQDEERIVFIERLIQEGLVVRKPDRAI